MSELLENSEMPAAPKWLSPVQEHHIDFLLEEEFAADPAFLTSFLEAAQEHSQVLLASDFPAAAAESNCSSVRSVTTDKGETDVLVVYQSTESFGRVAVLIENKIRAGFQPQQAERYQMRGETGKKSGEWDHFWTCLIAPERYTDDSTKSLLISLPYFVEILDESKQCAPHMGKVDTSPLPGLSF